MPSENRPQVTEALEQAAHDLRFAKREFLREDNKQAAAYMERGLATVTAALAASPSPQPVAGLVEALQAVEPYLNNAPVRVREIVRAALAEHKPEQPVRDPPPGYTPEGWAAKQAEVAEFSRRNAFDEPGGSERKQTAEARLKAARDIQCADVPDQFALVRRIDLSFVLGELVRHRAGHELAIEHRAAEQPVQGGEALVEPVPIAAGDQRVLLNGEPPRVPCRVVAEELYQRLIAAFRAAPAAEALVEVLDRLEYNLSAAPPNAERCFVSLDDHRTILTVFANAKLVHEQESIRVNGDGTA